MYECSFLLSLYRNDLTSPDSASSVAEVRLQGSGGGRRLESLLDGLLGESGARHGHEEISGEAEHFSIIFIYVILQDVTFVVKTFLCTYVNIEFFPLYPPLNCTFVIRALKDRAPSFFFFREAFITLL